MATLILKLITLHYFGFLYFFLQGKRIKPFKMEIPCVCWTVLFQVNTSRSHMIGGKKKLQSKLPSQDWGYRTFFKLVIEGGVGPAHCGWCHSWAGGPRFYKKAD